MNRRTKICVVTGTRAEFGIWRPVLAAIDASRKLTLQLLVTGMHLQKEFGHTARDIEVAGVRIDARVPMYRGKESPAESLARGTAGMAKAFRDLKPDLVMVLGDRLEILAAASAALAEQIPLAHVHGGETAPGQWDEQIRHGVTKIAHLHFCATKKAGERILQMGEDPARVHVAGAPAIDLAMQFAQEHERHPAYADRILVVLHPSSPDEQMEERRTRMVLHALRGRKLTIIGPNNDPGHRGIMAAYRRAGLGMMMSLPQQDFWDRLASCGFLIGNSSSGILEAATFGIPVINIGDRQAGRERSGNVIDVPWNAKAIGGAMKKALSSSFRRSTKDRKNVYGDGRAAERIVRILEVLPFPLPTTKRFFDRL
jgi:UDP-hydrolysing UDP-N-acetyl-D-glucosamine 2-epimerase